MTFIWKVPAHMPDPAALERIRQHFHKPHKFMPIAWFIAGETYLTDLDRDSDTKRLIHALEEIESGTRIFPGADGGTWSEWFHYLLPEFIIRACEPQGYDNDILNATLQAFLTLYPNEITEHYNGFRDDIIRALGLQCFPPQLARNRVVVPEATSRLFIDIWDHAEAIKAYGFQSLSGVWNSVIFCLRYLKPEEILQWAMSLFQIEHPQWIQQLIFLLPDWFNSWQSDEFKSSNGQLFTEVVHEQVTDDLFTSWQVLLLQEINLEPYNIEWGFYLTPILEAHIKQAKEALLGV